MVFSAAESNVKALILESEQKRLQLVFLELIEQNAGRITVLQLAKNAEISTQLAKQYLDEKAKELNADFEVNEEGNVLYHFSIPFFNFEKRLDTLLGT